MKKMMSVAAAAMVATSFASAEGQTAFNGFYAGAQLGGGFHSLKIKQAGAKDKSVNPNGFILGLLTGYNLRNDNFVLGLEAHLQKDFSSKKFTDSGDELKVTFTYNAGADVRLGYVFSEDMMVFGKVGFDYNRIQFKDTTTGDTGKRNKTPFTFGAGIEKSFGQYGLRLSYDYSRINLSGNKLHNHKVLVGAVYNF